MIHGLRGRTDVEVLTVEIDPATAQHAAANDWPDWVRLVIGDAVEVTRRSGSFDLIFADAPGGSGKDWKPPSPRYDQAPTCSWMT